MSQPDYENDLAFEPKMTWDDFMLWAKSFVKNESVLIHPSKEFFRCGKNLHFYKDGSVSSANYVHSEHRTYEQMKAIIENMFGEQGNAK